MSKIDKDICVSIGKMGFNECIEVLKICSLAEIRFDLLDFSNDEYTKLFNQDCNIIATYRPGATDELSRKKTLLKAIENGADYLDIELDAPSEYFTCLYNKAKKHNTKVIVSYHNYTETPTLNKLYSIVENSKSKGSDIVKIACQVNSPSDLSRLQSLYAKYDNIITIGMGKKGVISRVSALYLGSPFTYVSASDKYKTAPEQLSYKEYQQIINIIIESNL